MNPWDIVSVLLGWWTVFVLVVMFVLIAWALVAASLGLVLARRPGKTRNPWLKRRTT
jgi:hypothetical protein